MTCGKDHRSVNVRQRLRVLHCLQRDLLGGTREAPGLDRARVVVDVDLDRPDVNCNY